MNKTLLILFTCITFLWQVSCKDKDSDVAPAESLDDWTAASHGNDAEPDYSVAFPQDKVLSFEITMTAAAWQTIRDDMKNRTGNDFGSGGTGGGGGIGGGGGAGGGLDIVSGDPVYVPVSLKYAGKEWYKVGFRLKGNSSLSSAWRQGNYKLPFKIQFDEFEDTYPEIKNQRFYGFKEFSMSPAFNDNSLMKDKMVSDIFRMAGVPAARTAFCKIYIDYGAGLKYCGVYTIVEVIDDTMVKDQFGEDEGNIYKPESTFQSFSQANFEKKNSEDAADYSDVKTTIATLNSSTRTSNPAQWRAELEKTFNVDHFLKYLAVNNTIVNWDAYGAMAHNHYLYNHSSKKLMWIPWDFNEAMSGTTTTGGVGGGGRSAVALDMKSVANSWPLIRYLADDATYYAKYKSYVKDFTDNYFTSAKIDPMIDKNYNLISPYVIGSEPEQTKYSYLTNAAAFTTAMNQLKQQVITRNQAAKDFLK